MIAILKRLDAWLAAHRPDFALAPPLDAAALAAAEATLGRALPEELRTLYGWHDGQVNSGYGLVGGTWFLPMEQLLVQRRANLADRPDEAWWSDDWFPFLDSGQGDLVCVRADTCDLVQHFHDDDTRDTLGPSATALFTAIVEGLESGALAVEADDHSSVSATDEAAWEAIRTRHGIGTFEPYVA